MMPPQIPWLFESGFWNLLNRRMLASTLEDAISNSCMSSILNDLAFLFLHSKKADSNHRMAEEIADVLDNAMGEIEEIESRYLGSPVAGTGEEK